MIINFIFIEGTKIGPTCRTKNPKKLVVMTTIKEALIRRFTMMNWTKKPIYHGTLVLTADMYL